MISLLDSSLKFPLDFEKVTPFKVSHAVPKRPINYTIQRRMLGFALLEISNSNVVHFPPTKSTQLGFSLQWNSEIKFQGCVYLKIRSCSILSELLTQCQTIPGFPGQRRCSRYSWLNNDAEDVFCKIPESKRVRYYSGRSSTGLTYCA